MLDARHDWALPTRWVLGAAGVLGLFSTLQAYRLVTVSSKAGEPVHTPALLVLNLTLWFVPALLVPSIVRLSGLFPLGSRRPVLAGAVHVAGALVFSAVHIVTILAARLFFWGSAIKPQQLAWWPYLQRQYLTDLDWCLVTYAVIVGIAHAVAFHHESQARKVTEARLENRLIEERLRTLEAELNPHFLFNTLHAVSALLHHDPDGADRIISRLSDLLRLTLDRSGSQLIPLKDEAEFLEKYLDIAQIRFGDRLSVVVGIEPAALDAEVPRMILQPLVENAVKHGVSQRSAGRVDVSAGLSGTRLRVEIRDNGGGLRGTVLSDLRAGVGLSNTRARLECLYGPDHQLDILDSGIGLTVRMEVPYRRAAIPAGAATSFRVA